MCYIANSQCGLVRFADKPWNGTYVQVHQHGMSVQRWRPLCSTSYALELSSLLCPNESMRPTWWAAAQAPEFVGGVYNGCTKEGKRDGPGSFDYKDGGLFEGAPQRCRCVNADVRYIMIFRATGECTQQPHIVLSLQVTGRLMRRGRAA